MPSLSNRQAYLVFGCVLVSYTIQCELASYLNRVGYDKSFFLLYLTHSSYIIIGVLHWLALRWLRIPVEPLLEHLKRTVKAQLEGNHDGSSSYYDGDDSFPTRKAAVRLASISVLIALPAGIWYAAIPITSMTSLTALYNLNAFWAYILSIYYSRDERWQLRSGLAVGIACVGVMVMTYGDSKEDAESESSPNESHHLFGDLLGLVSSFACGFYEVWYKRYIALPSTGQTDSPNGHHASYSRLLADESDGIELDGRNGDHHTSIPMNGRRPSLKGSGLLNQQAKRLSVIPEGRESLARDSIESPLPENTDQGAAHDNDNDDDELQAIEAELYSSKILTRPGQTAPSAPIPPSLFLAHANSITCLIGVVTLLFFWIPIPVLHYMGWETFELPPDGTALLAVIGVCLGGVMFNTGFMILLSIWGPVVTSVGNLFTLILVAAADEAIALSNGYSALSLSTLLGSGFILASFGMLMTGPPAGH